MTSIETNENTDQVPTSEPIDDAAGSGLRVLLVHPGASWSTHDVYMGLRFGLSLHDVQTSVYQLDIRIARSEHWLLWNWKKSGQQGTPPTKRDVQYHAASGVLERAHRLNPDWILIVSGMFFDLDLVRFLRRAGFKIAVLLTESPYDDDAQIEYIKHVDLAWTNERTSVARLRTANEHTHYLPHAWHPTIHLPSPPDVSIPAHDALFIGSGFPERAKFFSDVVRRTPDLNLGLYGHWGVGSRSRLRPFIHNQVVDNAAAARFYQRAKVNINVHRTMKGFSTNDQRDIVGAESLGPRIYELAATGSFFVTNRRAELDDVFADNALPTFEKPRELADMLAFWAAPHNDEWRREIAEKNRQAVAAHSWGTRALDAIDDLKRWPDEGV